MKTLTAHFGLKRGLVAKKLNCGRGLGAEPHRRSGLPLMMRTTGRLRPSAVAMALGSICAPNRGDRWLDSLS